MKKSSNVIVLLIIIAVALLIPSSASASAKSRVISYITPLSFDVSEILTSGNQSLDSHLLMAKQDIGQIINLFIGDTIVRVEPQDEDETDALFSVGSGDEINESSSVFIQNWSRSSSRENQESDSMMIEDADDMDLTEDIDDSEDSNTSDFGKLNRDLFLRRGRRNPAATPSAIPQLTREEIVLDRLHCWIMSFNNGLSQQENRQIARWILRYCQEQNMDWRVMASLFGAESAYRPRAVSVVGAQGLGQLMPGTAAELGVRNSMDPQQNIEGSVRYLAGLWRMWEGRSNRLELTLASYNAGPGAVQRFGGIPPYRETINYVRTIKGFYNELCNERVACFCKHGAHRCPVAGHSDVRVAGTRRSD